MLPTADLLWPALSEAQFSLATAPGWQGTRGLLGRLAEKAEASYAAFAAQDMLARQLGPAIPDTDEWFGVTLQTDRVVRGVMWQWAGSVVSYMSLATQALHAAAEQIEPDDDGRLPREWSGACATQDMTTLRFVGPYVPARFSQVPGLGAAVEPFDGPDPEMKELRESYRCACCPIEHSVRINPQTGLLALPSWLRPMQFYADTVVWALCTRLRPFISVDQAPAEPAAGGAGAKR